jgi:hypothetical protein
LSVDAHGFRFEYTLNSAKHIPFRLVRPIPRRHRAPGRVDRAYRRRGDRGFESRAGGARRGTDGSQTLRWRKADSSLAFLMAKATGAASPLSAPAEAVVLQIRFPRILAATVA